VVDTIASGHFSRGDKDLFRPIVAKLLSARDQYVHLADLQPYIDRQTEVDALYAEKAQWLRKSVLNIARMGKFSSDRTIREYANEIWRIRPAVIGGFAHAALDE
jgi:starch phosphorylase